MKKKNYKKKIPFLKGRPKRVWTINSTDIVNLKIALETAKNFDQFLEMV